jgi:hypothetical protein
VLFFVEGFTDIRFVAGLSQICDLTMVVPTRQYADSGLKDRVNALNLPITVREIPGGRLAFQFRSLVDLCRCAGQFDVILAQEALRGALNANLAGALRDRAGGIFSLPPRARAHRMAQVRTRRIRNPHSPVD